MQVSLGVVKLDALQQKRHIDFRKVCESATYSETYLFTSQHPVLLLYMLPLAEKLPCCVLIAHLWPCWHGFHTIPNTASCSSCTTSRGKYLDFQATTAHKLCMKLCYYKLACLCLCDPQACQGWVCFCPADLPDAFLQLHSQTV